MQQISGRLPRLALAAVLLAVAAHAAHSQPSKPAGGGTLRTSVERLVRDLDSRTRSVRLRAERDLLALGPRILPLLPPPELTPNVSVREAVRRVRIRLENIAARGSVKPSRVTLKGTHSLKDVLAAVSQQTGNRFDTSKLASEALSAKIDASYAGATYWSVVGDLARRQQLRFRVLPGTNRIAVENAVAESPPLVADAGSAFRIAVLSLSERPIAGDADNRLLRVQWSLTAEPRLRPLFLKYGGGSLIAQTAAGKRLEPFDPEAKLEVAAVDGAAPIVQSTDFILPKGTAASAIRFRGRVQVLTAAGREAVEFHDLSRAKGSSKRRGGVTVTVNSVTAAPVKPKGKSATSQRVAVEVSVSYDVGGPAFESHRTWIFHNRVYLESGAKRIPAEPAFKTIVQSDGAVGVGYRFAVPQVPLAKLSFVYVAPTLLIDVPVDFDFHRIPITTPKQKRSTP